MRTCHATFTQRSVVIVQARFFFAGLFTIALLGLGQPSAGWAQDARAPDGPYNPSPDHPFGQPNPDAPPELEQFAFMIGEYDCQERLRQQDGSWMAFPATWHGYYFLNGYGIIDRYWNGRFATANTRIYDPAKGAWMVTYFQMPNYNSGTWEGQQEDETLVMHKDVQGPDGTTVKMRLTFSDITGDSFEWKGERVVQGETSPFWTSSCTRRR